MAGFRYLASPYSKYPGGMYQAYAEVCWIAARLFKDGIPVYSPIAHSHVIAKFGDLDPGFGFWSDFDEALITASDGMIIAMMPGWQESEGIAAEIEICDKLRKPVIYLNPVTLAMSPFIGGVDT